MAKIKKNKKKKGKKKRGGKSLADMDFSNVNLPSLNIDFNTGGGTSFFDDKLTALSELQSKLTPSVMQKKLDALIDVKKGKTSYVNSEIMNINRKTSRVDKGLLAEKEEFRYVDGKFVKEGTPYHIHYTTDLETYYMTQSGHNKITSKLIYRKRENEYSLYSRLSQSEPMKIKSSIVLPEKKDYDNQFMIRSFARKANELNSAPFEIKKNQIDSSPLYDYVTFKFRITGTREKVRLFNTKKIREASLTISNLDRYVNPFQFFKPEAGVDIRDEILEKLKTGVSPVETLDINEIIISTDYSPRQTTQTTTTTTTQTQTGPPPGVMSGGAGGAGGGGY